MSLEHQFADNIDFHVDEIKYNWCSNDIAVFYSNVFGECFCHVFKLKRRRVESLLYSALKAVLLNYPIHDLMNMNLPKTLKKYFVK